MTKRICLLSTCVALLGAGCGDDGMPPPDGGPDSGIDGGRDAGRDAGTDGGFDGGGMGDGNDSFEQAVPVPLDDMDGVMGVLATPRDHDYYRFTLDAEAWVWIATDANEMDDPMKVDTVITLYDSAMVQLAENDDAVPRVNTDSQIITRLQAGMYYVDVQEWTTWTMDPELEGDPSYTYALTVFQVSPDAPAVTLDPETGSPANMKFSDNFGLVIGELTDGSDEDVFSLTGAAGRALQITIMPWGTDGYGSTTSLGRVQITDMAGTDVIARINNATMGYDVISLPLAAGTFNVSVQHPGGASGSNDIYVMKAVQFDENPAETMEMGNNTRMGAEALSMGAPDMDMVRAGFILARLGTGDEDFFSFDVMTGEQVAVACGSGSVGSGVMGLRAEVQDDTGMTLSSATEMPPDNIFIEDAMIRSPGTYYLHLTKSGQNPMVSGDYVRCAVRAGPPPPMM